MSFLIAPRVYINGSRHVGTFNAAVSYEHIIGKMDNDDFHLLREAICQAESPFEPVANMQGSDFFAAYAEIALTEFPSIILKNNPNANDVRPTGSRTFYFKAKKMVKQYPGIPLPRISVQARDSGAGSASAKLMISGCAKFAEVAARPAG